MKCIVLSVVCSIATCGCEATAFLSFIGFRWKIRRKTRETAHALALILASDMIALNNAGLKSAILLESRKPPPLDLLSFS